MKNTQVQCIASRLFSSPASHDSNCQWNSHLSTWLASRLLIHLSPSGFSTCYADDLQSAFENPPAAARPWVFWYWNKCAISREGITADLEAMHAAGLGGAI